MSAGELLVIISKQASLFRAADGDTAFATFDVGFHRETWPVRSRAFRRWLVGHFYRTQQKPPGGQALADALGVIEARAQYESAIHPVHVRVAGDDDAVFLDLANDTWQAIRVTAAGWSMVSEQLPVKFKRSRGMLPLPTPVHGGAMADLRKLVNLANDDHWALCAAWLVAALRPSGPYPLLALLGEQGTTKSTLQEMFRALIDPNVAPLRAEPRDVRDVMIAASNGWCIAFDNLSEIEPWLSDCFCRLATGGGFSTRELYSDGDEMIFSAERPVMVNGIDAVISRADLLDRTVIIDLPRIPDDQRRQRRDLWAAFEAARPAILGALLDAVAVGLKRQPDVTLPALPRMADFAHWAVATEPGLGLTSGAFLAAYAGNRADAHGLALEASAIAAPIQLVVERDGDWSGTATELLDALVKLVNETTRKAKGWPTTARALGADLRRIAPNLRAVGIEVTFDREGHDRRRLIGIRKGRDSTVRTVRTVRTDPADGGATPENAQPWASSAPNSASPKAADDADAADAELPSRSCLRHPVTPRPDVCRTCRGAEA